MWRRHVLGVLASAATVGVTAGLHAAEPGLLGWWRFDEGRGDVAGDSSGRGNDGDVYHADWVRGPFGTALRLNGEGAHVAIPELADLDGSDALTLEAWVYWEGTGRYPNIFTLGRWCPGGGLMFVSDRGCSFRLGRPGHEGWHRMRDWQEVSAALVSDFELGRWYHLVATFQRPVIRTFLDGKEVGQATWDFPVGCQGDVTIGKWSNDVGHHGLVDEARVYGRALSSEEVAAHYAAGAHGRAEAEGEPYAVIPDVVSDEPPALAMENQLARLTFDKRLRITGVLDVKTGVNLLARSSSWMTLRASGRNLRPSAFTHEGGRLTVEFGDGKAEAVVSVEARGRYFVFEVLSVEGEEVEQLTFISLLAKPSERVHAMPGLAADEKHALCLRCLNLEAQPAVGGSPPALRASCSTTYGMEGARAALVACPTPVLRPVLKDMARAEGVVYSELGGAWALDAPSNRASYMFTSGLSEANVDEWIDMARTACIPYLHFSGWYRSQGHYEPRPDLFPNGRAGLKAVIDKIHAAGLLAGMHTLTGCIQPRDSFASPRPDARLSRDRVLTLAADVGKGDVDIPLVEDPAGLDTVWNYSSHGNVVRIADELVQFRGLKTEPPYALTRCTRGAWGSEAQAHGKGTPADHLFVRYTAFQPDEKSTLVDEVAECIANTVNECGFDLIYHDGAEGMPARAYGAAKMRTAIVERFRRPIRVESSWSGLHHCWWFHSCVGAWDHPLWGLKRCIDQHCESNVRYQELSLMPAQLGWWAILGPRSHHDAERPDEVEYLCAKALGHGMSMSFQTLTPASNPWNARQGEYLRMIGRYEKLRLSGYFDEAVKARLREPRQEFRLTQADDGEWQFSPTEYLTRKVVLSDVARRRWTVANRFAAQSAGLRVQALYGAVPYDDPSGVVVAELGREDEFSGVSAAAGVKGSFAITDELVKAGQSSARFTAVNESSEPTSAWARVGKVFSPDLDFGACAALGLWVHGDGKGEVINFQLRSPRLYHGAYDEHIVTVDFEGWRYFELLLRERDAGRHYDFKWPYGWAMSICRAPLDTRHVSELNIYYNNLPRGEDVTCHISPIRALPVVKTTWANPAVTIGGRRIVFPVTMESGQTIEYRPGGGCTLRSETGAVVSRVEPEGHRPELAAGDNVAELTCETEAGPTPRAEVTVVASGEPLRGVAPGKQSLKRRLRRLDDHYLSLSAGGDVAFVRQDRQDVRRFDEDGTWSVVNETDMPEAIVELRLRVGRATPGTEYDSGISIEEFEDASAFSDQATAAPMVLGPRRRGLAKEGVTVSATCSADGGRTGRSCAVLRAESTLNDRSGWAAAVRKLPSPVDLSAAKALGVWLKGDGKAAWLKLQLRDAGGGRSDYYAGLDSNTWRYCELAEPAVGRVDMSRVAAVVLYLVSVPAKGTATCWVGGLRGLRSLPTRRVANPRLSIGDAAIGFPVTLTPGDSLVLRPPGACQLIDRAGATRALRVTGSLPNLPPGVSSVRFGCDGGLSNEVRVTMTRK